MIEFEDKYFNKLDFSKRQIKRYFTSVSKDLRIARESDVAEVKFQFAYNALIKLGISLVACYGYKVSSKVGHHRRILEKCQRYWAIKKFQSMETE
jgi:hypothetical protein